MEPGSVWVVAAWIAIHLAALAAACGTRVAAGSCLEQFAQLCFFAAMAAIGSLAWLCQQMDLAWGWSALTLIAMVLTAVIDFRRMSEPAPASSIR